MLMIMKHDLMIKAKELKQINHDLMLIFLIQTVLKNFFILILLRKSIMEFYRNS